MADVRAMLRQERAARQQPARPPKQSAAPAPAPISKKRKAADETVEERKRTRTEPARGVPAGFFDGGAALQDNEADAGLEVPVKQQQIPPPVPVQDSQPRLDAADEEDLDAFMKEIEEPKPNVFSTYTSSVVIESAPMTAAEIAAQAREEQSAQRGERELELEAEKEDAERQLQDEFEEMDELEKRVKQLREKREALRNAHSQAQVVHAEVAPGEPIPTNADEDSDEEDEDWDDWRFRLA